MEQFEQGQIVQVRDELMKPWEERKYLTYANEQHWVISQYSDKPGLAYNYKMIRRAKDEYGNEPMTITEHKHPKLTEIKEELW